MDKKVLNDIGVDIQNMWRHEKNISIAKWLFDLAVNTVYNHIRAKIKWNNTVWLSLMWNKKDKKEYTENILRFN